MGDCGSTGPTLVVAVLKITCYGIDPQSQTTSFLHRLRRPCLLFPFSVVDIVSMIGCGWASFFLSASDAKFSN
eukprot:scaffold11212_cov121-Cylindrotheca_fusiformis.AAC.2